MKGLLFRPQHQATAAPFDRIKKSWRNVALHNTEKIINHSFLILFWGGSVRLKGRTFFFFFFF